MPIYAGLHIIFFFKSLLTYCTERERPSERGSTSRGSGREREAGFPPIRERDVGLDPRAPESRQDPSRRQMLHD